MAPRRVMARQKPNHKDYEPTLEGMSAYMSEVINWMIETEDLSGLLTRSPPKKDAAKDR